jgi:probable phosphomutase (TIGR03848 family)
VTVFYLVRHGVTSHTGHRLSGRTRGVHLTDEGTGQAQRAAGYLTEVPFEAIYSSPIDRCRETAQEIARGRGMRVRVRPGLVETEYGRWTNRSFKSLERVRSWEVVRRWPSVVRFPEGESLLEVQERAVEEIETLRREHPRGRVCCVSHSDAIKLILTHYLGLHIDMVQRFNLAPASVTILNVSDAGPVLLALNAGADPVMPA